MSRPPSNNPGRHYHVWSDKRFIVISSDDGSVFGREQKRYIEPGKEVCLLEDTWDKNREKYIIFQGIENETNVYYQEKERRKK